MVVLLVVATIIMFVLVDLAIQSYEAKKQGKLVYAGEKNAFVAEEIQLAGSTRAIRGFSENSYRIPMGVFFHKGHTWANILISGYVKVGIDDFVQRSLGRIDEVDLPPIGREVKQGEKVFSIKQGNRKAVFQSPIDGVVCSVNHMLLDQPDAIKKDPYTYGWLCAIKPSNLSENIRSMKVAKEAALWLKSEVQRFKETMMARSLGLCPDFATIQDGGEIIDGLLEYLDNESWATFEKNFLKS